MVFFACFFIIVSLRKFTVFPLISLVILLVGEIGSMVAFCQLKKNALMLISGILFIVAGGTINLLSFDKRVHRCFFYVT